MMFLFKRKPPSKTATDQAHLEQITAHKDAIEQAAKQNQKANAKLKQIFEDNHFTVRIALAMGARQTGGAQNHGH